MNCRICSLPLENELEEKREFHFACNKCELCGNEGLQPERIRECLNDGHKVSHLTCWQSWQEKEIAKRPITVTQETLDYLNRIRLIIEPNLQYSIEDNQSEAGRSAERYMHERSIDEQFIALKRAQAACAAMSVCYHNNKEQLNIRIKREETYEDRLRKDRKLVDDAESVRSGQDEVKRKKREVLSGDAKAIKSLMSAMRCDESTARRILGEGQTLAQIDNVMASKKPNGETIQ